MKNVAVLLLYNNQITTIPKALCQLPKLKKVSLQGSPINPTDVELLRRILIDIEITF